MAWQAFQLLPSDPVPLLLEPLERRAKGRCVLLAILVVPVMFWNGGSMAGYSGDETTGFQSPAQDHIEGVIDLAARLDLRRPNIYPCLLYTSPSPRD